MEIQELHSTGEAFVEVAKKFTAGLIDHFSDSSEKERAAIAAYFEQGFAFSLSYIAQKGEQPLLHFEVINDIGHRISVVRIPLEPKSEAGSRH